MPIPSVQSQALRKSYISALFIAILEYMTQPLIENRRHFITYSTYLIESDHCATRDPVLSSPILFVAFSIWLLIDAIDLSGNGVQKSSETLLIIPSSCDMSLIYLY